MVALLNIGVCYFQRLIAITPTLTSATIRVPNSKKNSIKDDGYNFLQDYYKAQWITVCLWKKASSLQYSVRGIY